jgi:hypothetical protein
MTQLCESTLSGAATRVAFVIGDKTHEVSIENSPDFQFGKNEVLASAATDVTFGQSWYPEGYAAINVFDEKQFSRIQKGLTGCIERIINEAGVPTDNFELRHYHRFVKTDHEHFKVVGKTRDLFPEDFNFPILEIIPEFEKILGFELSDINPDDGKKLHIIVRINRPFSADFNPPHKDIYEGVDIEKYIPQFVNLWIPIAGVTQKTSLPVVPSSHLLPESEILRTVDGAFLEGKKYRVRMIREWGGSNRMVRSKVEYGQVLFFSSHLVHGLAINEELNTTRVALEFRLFKKQR